MQASWSQCRTFLPQRHSPQFRLHLPAAEPIIVTSLIPLCCKSTLAGSFHGFLSDLNEALCLGPAINLCFPAAKCQQRNSIHVAAQHSVCASSSDGCRRIFVGRRGVPLSYTRQQLVDFLKRHADGLVCQSTAMTLLRWICQEIRFGLRLCFLAREARCTKRRPASAISLLAALSAFEKWGHYTLLHPSTPHILRV